MVFRYYYAPEYNEMPQFNKRFSGEVQKKIVKFTQYPTNQIER